MAPVSLPSRRACQYVSPPSTETSAIREVSTDVGEAEVEGVVRGPAEAVQGDDEAARAPGAGRRHPPARRVEAEAVRQDAVGGDGPVAEEEQR